MINAMIRHARRMVVFVIGGTVLLFGIALLVLPGPAILVIPIGLIILATEFLWAERLLKKVKGAVDRGKNSFKKKKIK